MMVLLYSSVRKSCVIFDDKVGDFPTELCCNTIITVLFYYFDFKNVLNVLICLVCCYSYYAAMYIGLLY